MGSPHLRPVRRCRGSSSVSPCRLSPLVVDRAPGAIYSSCTKRTPAGGTLERYEVGRKMNLIELLKEQKDEVAGHWFEAVAATYAKKTTEFMMREKNEFANPVGGTMRQSLAAVLAELLEGENPESLKKLLDPVIRIRAVQDFTAPEAVGFVFLLKEILAKRFGEHLSDPKFMTQLLQFHGRIDRLSLVAFEIYNGCREQIYAFKANHVKDRTMRLLKKADVLCEVPEVGTEIIPHNVYKNGGFES